MKIVAVERTALTLKDLVALACKETVVLTRRGKPLVSIKNVSGGDWESVALANDPGFQKLIEESRRTFREEGGISVSDVRTELGLKPASRRRRKPA